MTYIITTDNTFTYPNAPIVIDVAQTVTLPNTHQYIEQIDPDRIQIALQNGYNGELLTNNSFIAPMTDTYNLFVYVDNIFIKPYSIFVYPNFYQITQNDLVTIFCQELPNILNGNSLILGSMINGMCEMFKTVYQYGYYQYYTAITSLGANTINGNGYSPDWEFVYLGVNNFLQNAKYPAEIINTFMVVCSQTGVSIPDITILISRLFYQYVGLKAYVSGYWDFANNRYQFDLYYSLGTDRWILGTSILGDDTVLGEDLPAQFLWFIELAVYRLMPVHARYAINLHAGEYSVFNTDFYYDEVNDLGLFAQDGIIYDAYCVVNNNSQFNTQGFYKK